MNTFMPMHVARLRPFGSAGLRRMLYWLTIVGEAIVGARGGNCHAL
jgi:hypothetical protein